MSSPKKDSDAVSSSADAVSNGAGGSGGGGGDGATSAEDVRPPAKRPAPAVIEISDTDSDDSDICAVTSYQASADEVKRIRGADYSSTSSSSDYSSDSESSWEDDSVIIQDTMVRGKLLRAQLNPRANRTDDPKLNSKIKSPEVMEQISTHWKELKDHTSADITLTCNPFRLCLLHNLLVNPEIINNIVDDMNTLEWSRKKMDLYEFHQTADLASLTWQRSIRGIYELLKTDVMSWVSQITGITLSNVSASCSLYGPGDHLLVHDDLLGDRRVAFILYLAPWRPNIKHYQRLRQENGQGDGMDCEAIDVEECGWGSHMGGALELIGRDALGLPTKKELTIYPRNNMLAFFPVNTDSYHQVGEVLSLELPRLSINGWFHGPAPALPDPPPPVLPDRRKPHHDVVLMGTWVSGAYMAARARAAVQAQVERHSEVCLRDFLVEDKYRVLLRDLAAAETQWEWCGPSTLRHYERLVRIGAVETPNTKEASSEEPKAAADATEADATGADAKEAVKLTKPDGPGQETVAEGLLKLMSSTAFFRLLCDCTDLTLNTYEKLELQRWRPGDFSLLPPHEFYQEARLEAVMYLGVPDRPICGGSTTYVAPEEGGDPSPATPATLAAPATPAALVTLPPVSNALNLVYCDAGAAGFTKYLSKMTMGDDDYFYILTCTYRE